MTTLSTHWGFVINNPDENDKLIVRTMSEQYVKSIVWTPEEEATPHLQGWLRLHRQQRMSFVKKLLPRANLQPLTKDEYIHNARMYATKDDDTTAGNHVVINNETMPDPINFLTRVIEDWVEHNWEELTDHSTRQVDQVERINAKLFDKLKIKSWMDKRERELVQEKPWLVKLILSPMYEKAKKFYWKEFLENRIQHKQNADDDEREGTGQTNDDETKSTSSSEEEEDSEEDIETEQGSDSSSESDCEEERGDEVCD